VIDTQQGSTGYNGKQKRKTHVMFLHRVKSSGILFLPPQNFVSRCKVCFVFWMNFLVRDFVFLEGSCNFFEDYLVDFNPKTCF
jgi:hypothetical protein